MSKKNFINAKDIKNNYEKLKNNNVEISQTKDNKQTKSISTLESFFVDVKDPVQVDESSALVSVEFVGVDYKSSSISEKDLKNLLSKVIFYYIKEKEPLTAPIDVSDFIAFANFLFGETVILDIAEINIYQRLQVELERDTFDDTNSTDDRPKREEYLLYNFHSKQDEAEMDM